MTQGRWQGHWGGEWLGDGGDATYPRPVAQSLLASYSVLADGLTAVQCDLPCAYSVLADEEQTSGGPDAVPAELRRYAARRREAWLAEQQEQTAEPVEARQEQQQGGEPETRDPHGVEVARSIRAPATIETARLEADLAQARRDVAKLLDEAAAATELDDDELALVLALMD